MSRIATSIPTIRGLGALRRADGIVHQAMERLATGKRINRASDDPAGMQIAEGLRFQQTTLNKRITGAEREIHRLGAQEGALSVMSDLAVELRGLTIQAASTGGLTEGEREAIFEQAASIIKSADFIANTSTFAGELSRVEDADFARETAELVRGQILQQAAIHTTKIASENARSVLALLESAAVASERARPAGNS